MHLTVIRHGQPDETGTDDPPLTEQGMRQAMSVNTALARYDFDFVMASPSQRARQTAEPYLQASGQSVHIEKTIAEIDYGDDEYIRVEDARARGDETWELWKKRLRATVDQPAEAAFINGFKQAFEQLAETHNNKHILVFAHGGVVNGLTALATGSQYLWIMLPDYCGISRFEYRKGRFVLKTLNEIAHLDMGAQLSAADLTGD